jgi:MFS family permease
MFYLIMNVFPYSGFMALHLLNTNTNSGDVPPLEEFRVQRGIDIEIEIDRDDDHSHHHSHNNIHNNSRVYAASDIGPFAGLLASSFRLGRIPTAIAWGRCADVYGRKFALVASGVAMVAGNLLLGLAPTFVSAVGIRFCTGLCNGTMVVVRTSISEIAGGDSALEARGVAMMSSMSGYG